MPFTDDSRAVWLRLGEWSALQVRLHWVYEGPVPVGGRNHFSRGVPNFSSWLLLQGTAEARAGGRILTARRGDWLIPMLPPRRQRFSPDARILSLNFQLAWPSGETLFPQNTGCVFPARRFPQLERHARRLLQAVRNGTPRDVDEFTGRRTTLRSYLRLQQYLPAWIEAFVDVLQTLGHRPIRIGPTDERLLRAIVALDTFPSDPRRSRHAAAEAAGLSPSQLDRLFVAFFGLTPRAYLDRKKIEAACVALEGSRTSVKEISYRLGFRQPTHFTAWFRQHQGQPPRAYRDARLGPLV